MADHHRGFQALAGQADPRATTAAFREAARRHGAHFATSPVTDLRTLGRTVSGVFTSVEPVAAETVVLAAGAWSGQLAAPLLTLPVEAAALQMLATAPGPGALRPTITAEGRRLSLKQLPDGSYLVGGGWPGAIHHGVCEVLPESVERSWQIATGLFPPLADAGRPRQSWCGLEGVTPDGVPLIGRPAGVTGLYVCAAFCAHGFQLAPAVGRAVADDLAGRVVPELAAFSPVRFGALSRSG